VPGLILVGEGANRTVIRYDDHAKRPLPSGEPMNTFNSYTMYIGSPNFRAESLSIENSAGDGRVVGQAIACYVDADRAMFLNCRISGHQDTLFLGPLPRDPLPKGLNLTKSKSIAAEGDEKSPMRSYFRACEIEGDVDFIFGSSTAVFSGCKILSLDRGESVNGYIAAPSTLPGQEFGFVFHECDLRAAGTVAPGSVYLARPWRPRAKAAFIRCRMGGHIANAAWDDWNSPANRATCEFVECESDGPGARVEGRASWARFLGPRGAARFDPEAVLRGRDAWNPASFKPTRCP
jgi:pectinesterase